VVLTPESGQGFTDSAEQLASGLAVLQNLQTPARSLVHKSANVSDSSLKSWSKLGTFSNSLHTLIVRLCNEVQQLTIDKVDIKFLQGY